MEPLSSVEWGPIDANRPDDQFSEKWIEPEDIKNCLDPQNWIVSGEKGSGKSAIRRAIMEVHCDQYFVAGLVSFNQLTFKAIADNLADIAATTKMARTTTLSNYWQYCVIVELVRACAERQPSKYADLVDRIPAHRKTPRKEFNKGLLKLLEEAWRRIESITAPDQDSGVNLPESGGLSAEALHELSIFPLTRDYHDMKDEFFRRLRDYDHPVILILDDLDRIRNDITKSDAIQLIFDSLADALLALRADSRCPKNLAVKALIPHDRYMAISLRDTDKMSDISIAIRWHRRALQQFVRKRIEATTNIKGPNFSHVWHQIMPRMVTNPHHGLEEHTFDYLLRHTMMRPRQLQIHLDDLSKRHPGTNIDPSMIPKSVAASSEKLAKFFIEEFSLDRPDLERFILTFSDQDNVMDYKTFRDFVINGMRRFEIACGATKSEDVIDDLYSMGLFGVVRYEDGQKMSPDTYYPPTREGKKHYIEFSYRRQYSKMSARLRDESLVALHPIFVHFANLKPHQSLVIG